MKDKHQHWGKMLLGRCTCWATLIAAILLLGSAILADRTAAEPPGQPEFDQAVAGMVPRPSTDATPIDFSVGSARYRMPRNYLITMGNWNGGPQALVTVRVSIPDFKPISEDNRTCFENDPTARPRGCKPFEFRLEGPSSISADGIFENSRSLFHTQSPIMGPFGYEEYEIGPKDARTEYYRKTESGRTLLYSCDIGNVSDHQDGVCRPLGDRTSTGSTLNFFFDIRELADIDQIDAKLHRLVEHFAVQPGGSSKSK